MTAGSTMRRVLVVDDHQEMAAGLADYLKSLGYRTDTATGVRMAVALMEERAFDAVITDLRMGDEDGFEIIDACKQLPMAPPVFVMTAFGSVETAIEAIKRGAYHYFAKPLNTEEVRVFLERSLTRGQQERTRRVLQRDMEQHYTQEAWVGDSEAMGMVSSLIDRVAHSTSPVLVTGESGTGKELVARSIHYRSQRRERAFVPVNCAAIPHDLLESELFGYERGAFTGAARARAGLVLEAHEGTLFLDEVGDLPLAVQPKLLRMLQEGEVRAVGSDLSRLVDVRVVAATHVDLEKRVMEGTFREDLFYRLNVVPITLPPLRERPEDIPALCQSLLAGIHGRNPHVGEVRLGEGALGALKTYEWPGNVRELGNALERAVTLATSSVLEAQDFAFLRASRRAASSDALTSDLPSLRELERRYIEHVMAHTDGNRVKAAAILGVDPSTLYRRQKRT